MKDDDVKRLISMLFEDSSYLRNVSLYHKWHLAMPRGWRNRAKNYRTAAVKRAVHLHRKQKMGSSEATDD